tara:strand:- start:4637 stop:5230 length:594 start_codon:yes stop_codon:yes gene_type:complete
MTRQKEKNNTEDFRLAMRRFAATVSIITTISNDKKSLGMAATAVTSLSFDPLSILIAVNQNASMFKSLQDSGIFCINVLQSKQTKQCDIFSRKETRDQRFKIGNWETGYKDLPYLANAQASIFCNIDQEINAGSHSAFIGLVKKVLIDESISPLIYINGGFLDNSCLEQQAEKTITPKGSKKLKTNNQGLDGLDWLW